MSPGSQTKTFLAGALALGGVALASAPAAASDISVRVQVGQSHGYHQRSVRQHQAVGFQQAQYYGDDFGYRRRRDFDGPRYGFGGGFGGGFGHRHYGHGGFGGCRIVIRERINRFGELVQIRRKICG